MSQLVEFLKSTGHTQLMDMRQNQQDTAINLILSSAEHRKEVLGWFDEYLLADYHLQSALLLPDLQCGRSIKNSIYAAMEPIIQKILDEIHGN